MMVKIGLVKIALQQMVMIGVEYTNSGVQNFWFYLLTDGGSGVNDIGDTFLK